PRTRTELFLAGTVPTQPDNLYQTFKIDSRTGQLVEGPLRGTGANTPPEFVIEEIFLVLPPQALEWARQNGIAQIPPPRASAQIPITNYKLQITSPDPNTIYQITPQLPRASQQVPLRVIAAQPLSSVSFILDERLLATVAVEPFELWWPLEPGAHTLRAEARLASGEVVRSEVLSFLVNP
ncbi:MAG: hypothetical protein ACRDH2_02200, partial [Anaerolineales bacterium]